MLIAWRECQPDQLLVLGSSREEEGKVGVEGWDAVLYLLFRANDM